MVGWRLLDEEGGLKLRCLWKLRDFKCGVELINRIYEVAEAAGQYPILHLEQPNQVRAELWTASIGKPLNKIIFLEPIRKASSIVLHVAQSKFIF